MIYILSIIFVPLVFMAIAAFVGVAGRAERGDFPAGRFLLAGVGVSLLFVLALTLGASIKQVPAGHVGLVYTFGDITNQRSEGLQTIWPWQGFRTASVQTQKVHPTTTCANGVEQCLGAFSEETQDVYIKTTLNLKVSPRDIQGLFTEVGPDYLDKIVLPRLLQIFKDETVKFEAVEIAPARETIRVSVRERLSEELGRFSIQVEDLLIDDIEFPEAFKAAIVEKQVASQNAQKEAELIKAAENKAQQKIEQARGVAEANRVIAASISPILVQWEAIQKFQDDVQIILLPAGEGLLIDPATLIGTAERP